MRLTAALALFASLLAFGLSAEASCAPPEPLQQRIARADAVVFARVMGFEGIQPNRRALMVQVLRVYKGSVPERIFVAAGPGGEGGGAPGQVVVTSVDYAAEPGTEHVFYLKQHAPAGFSTDACSGSHPGALDAEERGLLGDGQPPDRAAGGAGSATDADRALGAIATIAALAAAFGSFRFALAR